MLKEVDLNFQWLYSKNGCISLIRNVLFFYGKMEHKKLQNPYSLKLEIEISNTIVTFRY
jgi:hypothetical protein